MATEAFTIVSHYTTPNNGAPSAVEKEAILSSDLDALWESEAGPSNISLRRRIPPRFVPASEPSSLLKPSRSLESLVKAENNDIGSWYSGLTRTHASTPQPRSDSVSKPVLQPTPQKKPPKPNKNDWFIRRALSNAPADTAPVQAVSLADMLQQDPPSLENPVQPPVFLHIGPNNPGWGMLQRHGWEEGKPLGLSSAPDTPAASTPPPDTDFTGEIPSSSARTALITPLRTTLKVDKRGIGPKSRSSPKPAVTHSLSDIRMAAERARRERDGRGKRGFARTARREAEERSQLFQALK